MNKKLTSWDIVNIARGSGRKTSLDYIVNIFDDFVELHGDRCGYDDKAMVCGLATYNGIPVTVIAEQKGRTTKENIERNFGMPNPESYRKAIRFMKQAEKFNRPIITFIDTKGAYPGVHAEEFGQGEAISKSMFTLVNIKVPVISLVIGEGSSGGALAIGVANKVLMLEYAVYSILSPEGFSSILWKDASRKIEAADKMKLTSRDLLKLNVIDKVIEESLDDSDDSFMQLISNIKNELNLSFDEFNKMSSEELVDHRYKKFRNMGIYKNEVEAC